MIVRLAPILVAAALAGSLSRGAANANDVTVRRVPDGGIKASAATDAAGVVHLVYFSGNPSNGDVMYVTSSDDGASFSKPIRVNSQPGSAMGASSARGPHLALGRNGSAHVIWMGSSKAQPRAPLNPAMPADSPYNGTPLLYARMDAKSGRFSEQRNLMTKSVALDGDSAIAADSGGRVYVAWHGQALGGKGEADRAVWLARSNDDGATFIAEQDVLSEPTGVCACCGLTVQTDGKGSVAILYRSATESIHRGMRLLASKDQGVTFANTKLDEWQIGACPMSTASLVSTPAGFVGAWENNNRLTLDRTFASAPEQIAGNGARKHPSVAFNAKGESLVAWAEGIGFGKGGAVGWQRFDREGKAIGATGHADGLPAHGNVAAVSLKDGGFVVIY